MNRAFDLYLRLVDAMQAKKQAGLDGDKAKLEQIADKMLALADLMLTEVEPLSFELRLDAAFAYYAAGYYARAAHLLQAEAPAFETTSVQHWLWLFLVKHLRELQDVVDSACSSELLSDQMIADSLRNGVLVDHLSGGGTVEEEIVERVLSKAVAECVKCVLEFAHDGSVIPLEHLDDQLKMCEQLAIKVGDPRWWWRIISVRYIFREFVENSLWTRLRLMQGETDGDKIIRPYVAANYGSSNPVVELWRSQVESLELVNDAERRSFCLRMPTGAGKTRVAELFILRFLLDHQAEPETKCVYIAPFRSLAREVESGFESIEAISGIHVSRFYGGHELDPLDQLEARQARVLVLTPEKLDALMRQTPDLISHIRLVIADEGHLIGDNSDRGHKYRILLERLVYLLKIKHKQVDRRGVRLLFISGVLSNVQELAGWLTGDSKNGVDLPWRPGTTPVQKTWLWSGSGFRDEDSQRSIFITLPGSPQARLDSASAISATVPFVQAVAGAAIYHAQSAPTMLFSPAKSRIKSPSMLDALESLVYHNPFGFYPLYSAFYEKHRKFVRYCQLLEKGVAIHHADLPAELKREMEARLADGRAQLVLASPTLAQGVNFPIQRLLVYGLDHGYDTPMSPTTFWNVVGRVGRPVPIRGVNALAGPPEVVFLIDCTSTTANSDRERLARLRRSENALRVESGFLEFLLDVKDQWVKIHDPQSISTLVLHLAENDLSWVDDEILRSGFAEFLARLDQHLNDLSRLSALNPELGVADCLQEVTAELMQLLRETSEFGDNDLQFIAQAVQARAKFVSTKDARERQRSYLLGVSEATQVQIMSHQEELLSWYSGTVAIFAGGIDEGLDCLAKIARFISQLPSFASNSKKMDFISQPVAEKKAEAEYSMTLFDLKDVGDRCAVLEAVLKAWIGGHDESEVIHLFCQIGKPDKYRDFREEMLERMLPWGMSAVGRWLTDLANERGLCLPKELEYLPSMIKYGVPSPIACYLVRRGLTRRGAVNVSGLFSTCSHTIEDNISEDPLDVPSDLLVRGVDSRECPSNSRQLSEHQIEGLQLDQRDIERLITLRQSAKM